MIGTNMLHHALTGVLTGTVHRRRNTARAALVTSALLCALTPCASAAPPAAAQSSPASAAAAPSTIASTADAQIPGVPLPPQTGGDVQRSMDEVLQGLKKSAPESGEGAASAPDTRSLDQQIQDLKKDVVDLNRDLFVLEEELLFPSNTQVAVFLSMDVGQFFALDSVQLKIDRKEVLNYLYTPREVDALLKGGVQRLYLGNLKVGSHEVVAFFSGKGPNDRPYRRGAWLKFDKGVGAKYLELKIDDRQHKLAPEFAIKDWE
jgi:hypothetical protein